MTCTKTLSLIKRKTGRALNPLGFFKLNCKHVTIYHYGYGFVRVRYGGGDGSRTRVRKFLADTFYERSSSFTFPRVSAEEQADMLGSFISSWQAAKLTPAHVHYLGHAEAEPVVPLSPTAAFI